jgi:hypothetical protein
MAICKPQGWRCAARSRYLRRSGSQSSGYSRKYAGAAISGNQIAARFILESERKRSKKVNRFLPLTVSILAMTASLVYSQIPWKSIAEWPGLGGITVSPEQSTVDASGQKFDQVLLLTDSSGKRVRLSASYSIGQNGTLLPVLRYEDQHVERVPVYYLAGTFAGAPYERFSGSDRATAEQELRGLEAFAQKFGFTLKISIVERFVER